VTSKGQSASNRLRAITAPWALHRSSLRLYELVGALAVVFAVTDKTFPHQREKATDDYVSGRFG